jgi:glycosyltransferase involved in cell wall biosynthesis
MRILHVNEVANVGSTLVAGLKQLGHSAELRRLRLVAGRSSTAIKLLALPLRLQEAAAVNRQVKAAHPDIVHIHFAYLGWLGIVGRYPYFLHCHGTDIRHSLYDPIRRWPVIQSLKRARAVFFSTPDLASSVRSIRPDAIFLPNPINIDRFWPAVEPKNQPLKILIGSAFHRVKKVNVAFEAVQQLLTQRPEVKVTAIDQGPDRKRYYGKAGVTFTAPVPYEQMPVLINTHDIVVGQFGIGSLGMMELESLACGKPVVAYAEFVDCYPEPPPVFSANQPAQVAEYLLSLVDDLALRRNSGEQGRAWVQQYHGYITIARLLEQVYLGQSPAGLNPD